ncbi:MAG: helix-turn-helix domain-containing protein [Kofleriaceae bacterium]|nr:helix-turn-helix domain-containing protein [Kofleriaceae bacterium]MBP6838459.1 helix-turn-helix domain-containing protein [Kofleriaceae bacterium]
MARARTLTELAAEVDALRRKVEDLAAARPPAATPRASTPAGTTGDDLLALVERRNPAPRPGTRPHRQRGAVLYGGALSVGSGEYLWALERPAAALLGADVERVAAALALLASGPRLRIVLALIDSPRSAAELQKLLGSSSPGPVYHHLRELVGTGLVVQTARHYAVAARHVVPVLAAVTAALDLGHRPGS